MNSKIALAKYIDHTLLRPDATTSQIIKLCEEAKKYAFAAVCVNSNRIKLVASELKNTDILPCCVIGFPLGAVPTECKVTEASIAIDNGAKEIDMVIDIGAAKDGDWNYVEKDIATVASVCGSQVALKVIIECCLLTDDEKVKACLAAKNAGADFVKTSTGFSTSGASVHDVKLLRNTVGPNMGVKAAGGIRTREDALKMIEAGANRIGTSAGISIINC